MTQDELNHLRDAGLQYLQEQLSTMSIEKIGNDENESPVYGIRYSSPHTQVWYNDNDNDNEKEVLSWSSKEDAQYYLDQYVLPNLGLIVVLRKHRETIRNFQFLLKELETA